jgi:hypothetical protein
MSMSARAFLALVADQRRQLKNIAAEHARCNRSYELLGSTSKSSRITDIHHA